jgi:hypothetical protein
MTLLAIKSTIPVMRMTSIGAGELEDGIGGIHGGDGGAATG